MTNDEIVGYLSAALDQEACKATLRSALISRFVSLRQRGIPQQVLFENLERMCQDIYQINDDVILEVIDWASDNQPAS